MKNIKKTLIALFLIAGLVTIGNFFYDTEAEKLQKERSVEEEFIKLLDITNSQLLEKQESIYNQIMSVEKEKEMHHHKIQYINERLQLIGSGDIPELPAQKEYSEESGLSIPWEEECNNSGKLVWEEECVTTEEYDERMENILI